MAAHGRQTMEAGLQRRLPDGRVVTIRPIRASDAALEHRFISDLSGESRYLRFHKWVTAPSVSLIHFLTDVDHDQHVALVCVASRGEGEQLVGEGRFIREPNSKRCEFGIVIADDWHRTGIAGLLMAALMRAAKAKGLETMEGVILRTNRSMLRFVRALGFEVLDGDGDRETVRVVKHLDA